MTEAELIEEIAMVTRAIHDILQGGQGYMIGTGGSQRQVTNANLPELRKMRSDLRRELAEMSDDGAGMTLGVGW